MYFLVSTNNCHSCRSIVFIVDETLHKITYLYVANIQIHNVFTFILQFNSVGFQVVQVTYEVLYEVPIGQLELIVVDPVVLKNLPIRQRSH
jgi:hypothetical protein